VRPRVAKFVILLTAQALFAEPLGTAEIVGHLARTIDWYRHIAAIEQPPSDLLARDSAHRAATRALQLAFEFARAARPLVAPEPRTAATPNLAQASNRAAERVANAEAQLAQLDASLAKAGGAARATLAARRNELLAEFDFAKQVRDSLQGVRTLAPGGADLLSFVDRLERSVPEALGAAQPQPAPAAANDAAAFRPESAGIVALIGETVAVSRTRKQLEAAIAETETLRKNLDQLRAPVTAELTGAIRRSEAAIADSASQTVEQIESDRREIVRLAARFKPISAALTPLREHGVQIDLARAGLVEQRTVLERRSSVAVRYLVYRAGGLIVTVLVILAISELWRRGTFRYVRDARRRKQFLVLRRVVVSSVILLAIGFALVNEMGSLATYAGFLTAGLAVALQNPISSVVAYFFLIGRYGLKVGDRVTISGVTGDVVEIGLVRLYLMEMTGTAADLYPTGRIVGFSNSVLFQPAALFRQMPGAEYVWRAAAVTLAADTDPEIAESRLMEAVDAVYEPYRERVEQQHAAFQRLVDVPIAPPKPIGRLRPVNDGLEFVVRYPAEMSHASATDDRVVQALAKAVSQAPPLAVTPSGTPRLLVGSS
jgi:small-conductance mechanosensitive channel